MQWKSLDEMLSLQRRTLMWSGITYTFLMYGRRKSDEEIRWISLERLRRKSSPISKGSKVPFWSKSTLFFRISVLFVLSKYQLKMSDKSTESAMGQNNLSRTWHTLLQPDHWLTWSFQVSWCFISKVFPTSDGHGVVGVPDSALAWDDRIKPLPWIVWWRRTHLCGTFRPPATSGLKQATRLSSLLSM